MTDSILDQNSQLTPAASEAILSLASSLACECPRYLVKILESVREFKAYEQQCILSHPKDRDIHLWLERSANNFDQMISATICQLARMEGMIDGENRIVSIPHEK